MSDLLKDQVVVDSKWKSISGNVMEILEVKDDQALLAMVGDNEDRYWEDRELIAANLTLVSFPKPPKSSRPMTVDQARTRDLERRGLRNATVRSDGLRAVIELAHVNDFDKLADRFVGRSTIARGCSACGLSAASVCTSCAAEAQVQT